MTADIERRAQRLSERACTDTVSEQLLIGGNEYTGEFVCYDEPPIAHLNPDEQPHAMLFSDLKGVGIGSKRNTVTPDGRAKSVFIITDQRLLLLVGQQDGDWVRPVSLEAVTASNYHTGVMKHRVVVETSETSYHLWVDVSYGEPALDSVVELLESTTERGMETASAGSTGAQNAVSDGIGPDVRTAAGEPNTETEPGATGQTDGSDETDDPLELLKQLKELQENGVITDEEFQAKKSELLDQI